MTSSQDTLRTAVLSDDVRVLHQHRDALKAQGNARDENGRTLLHVAVAAGAVDSALWLADNRIANVNQADNQGETPLMRAASLGQVDVIETLVRQGADIHAKARTGGTALHYAYDGGKAGAASIDVLVKAGADTKALDKDGRLPEAWSGPAAAREAASELLNDGAVGKPAPRTLRLKR